MKQFARLLCLVVMTMSLGGCVAFAEALAEASAQQNGGYDGGYDEGYDDYEHVPRNTSAAGIK